MVKMSKMLTTKQLVNYFGISQQTVLNRVKEMKNYVGEGKRYPSSALISDGHITRVDKEAFADFLNARRQL